jgi:hypothetical protein
MICARDDLSVGQMRKRVAAVGFGDQEGGLDSSDQGLQFVPGEPVVQGHEGEPRPGSAEEGDGERQAGLVEHCDVIDTLLPGRVRGGPRSPKELAIRESLVSVLHGDPVAKAGRGHFEEHHEVHGVILEGLGSSSRVDPRGYIIHTRFGFDRVAASHSRGRGSVVIRP